MEHYLRPLQADDISQVAELEREAFPTTWPPTSFKREMENRLARYLVACVRPSPTPVLDPAPGATSAPPGGAPSSLVRRLGEALRTLFLPPAREGTTAEREPVDGYVGIWFMADEAHITSIAVRERCRRLGIGELLLQGAIQVAQMRHARCATLEVRVSNHAAQTLYEKYGFRKMGIRKGYYADNHENAVVMTTNALASPSFQEQFAKRLDAFRQRHGDAVRSLA